MRKLHWLIVFILVLGCATVPPLIRDIESQQIVKAHYKRVWVPVNNFFSERKIPVKKVSIDDGVLVTEPIKIPYEGFAYESQYCDCGTLGGIYVYREILGKFNVTIQGINKDTTKVTIHSDYRAALWGGNTFMGWVRCQSKGLVEDTFFEKLASVFKEKTEEPEQSAQKERPGERTARSQTDTFL